MRQWIHGHRFVGPILIGEWLLSGRVSVRFRTVSIARPIHDAEGPQHLASGAVAHDFGVEHCARRSWRREVEPLQQQRDLPRLVRGGECW